METGGRLRKFRAWGAWTVLNGVTLTHRRADPGPGRVKEPPRSPEEGDSREANARLSLWLAVPSPCSEPEWTLLSSWGRQAPQAGPCPQGSRMEHWGARSFAAHVAGQAACHGTWHCPGQAQWALHTGREGRLQAHLAGPDHPAPPLGSPGGPHRTGAQKQGLLGLAHFLCQPA